MAAAISLSIPSLASRRCELDTPPKINLSASDTLGIGAAHPRSPPSGTSNRSIGCKADDISAPGERVSAGPANFVAWSVSSHKTQRKLSLLTRLLYQNLIVRTRRGAAICQTTGLTSVEVHVTRMAAFGCGTLLLMVEFSGQVRQWRDDKPGGLAVVDIPEHLVADLGGRRQMRVTGSLNEATFTGSTMLVTGGGMCVGVSKAALKSAGATVGDQVRLSIVAAAS